MILFVNGCSHTAAAEAVNPHAFASDDPDLWLLGRRPHPDNERVSWGYRLAGHLGSAFVNLSESASSNVRILRTSRIWLDQQQHLRPDIFMIIQWSTWEREEWRLDGDLYQVNGSGVDHVPEAYQDRYRQWIVDLDWAKAERYWHREIWNWHLELQGQGVRHMFFNGNNHFGSVPVTARHDWGRTYLDPYRADRTFDSILRQHGHKTVNAHSWHFGSDAHCFWAQFLLQYAIDQQLIEPHAISLD